MKMTDHTIGIDISKARLDVFDSKRQEVRSFNNTEAGFRELSKWLVSYPPTRVVYEPTGPYHRNFEEHFCGKWPLVKVNPLQARRFSEACGTRAKTDALDARGLARMGAVLELEPDVPVSKTTRVLKDLQLARTALVKDRTRLRNRSHIQSNKVLQRQTNRAPNPNYSGWHSSTLWRYLGSQSARFLLDLMEYLSFIDRTMLSAKWRTVAIFRAPCPFRNRD